MTYTRSYIGLYARITISYELCHVHMCMYIGYIQPSLCLIHEDTCGYASVFLWGVHICVYLCCIMCIHVCILVTFNPYTCRYKQLCTLLGSSYVLLSRFSACSSSSSSSIVDSIPIEGKLIINQPSLSWSIIFYFHCFYCFSDLSTYSKPFFFFRNALFVIFLNNHV